jgi:tRNA pseudouridine38-40 synthase
VPKPAQSAPELQTWKLTVAYDGTDFSGWQVQPGELTIQGELQAALGRITGEAPLPQGSGRTDAGVHALAQVASFGMRAPIPPQNLHRALNRTLPAKSYEYRIFRGEICPPFLARYVYSCPWPIDTAALEMAARAFVGEHNFLSFAASDPDLASRSADRIQCLEQKGQTGQTEQMMKSSQTTTIRTIHASGWEQRQTEDGALLVYRVRGTGFLHHMVRNLVGTMLEVGCGLLQPSDIPEILAARNRSAAGPTAPARGLFLHSVEYE